MLRAEDRLLAHRQMARLEHGDRETIVEAGVGG